MPFTSDSSFAFIASMAALLDEDFAGFKNGFAGCLDVAKLYETED